MQYSPTACGTLRKHFTKHFTQPASPDCTVVMHGITLRPGHWGWRGIPGCLQPPSVKETLFVPCRNCMISVEERKSFLYLLNMLVQNILFGSCLGVAKVAPLLLGTPWNLSWWPETIWDILSTQLCLCICTLRSSSWNLLLVVVLPDNQYCTILVNKVPSLVLHLDASHLALWKEWCRSEGNFWLKSLFTRITCFLPPGYQKGTSPISGDNVPRTK